MAWKVPVLSQRTPSVCWEACARMMWLWKYKNLSNYATKAGPYTTRNAGMTETEMNHFYTLLGMRSLRDAKGMNLRHALKWTPVIFTDIRQTEGHAMVLTGFDEGKYTVVNPCALQSIDFETDTNVCAANTLSRPQPAVEEPLGSYIWYW